MSDFSVILTLPDILPIDIYYIKGTNVLSFGRPEMYFWEFFYYYELSSIALPHFLFTFQKKREKNNRKFCSCNNHNWNI